MRLLSLLHLAAHVGEHDDGYGYVHAQSSDCVSVHGRGCVSGHEHGRERRYESGGYGCCSCSVRYVYSGCGCDLVHV